MVLGSSLICKQHHQLNLKCKCVTWPPFLNVLLLPIFSSLSKFIVVNWWWLEAINQVRVTRGWVGWVGGGWRVGWGVGGLQIANKHLSTAIASSPQTLTQLWKRVAFFIARHFSPTGIWETRYMDIEKLRKFSLCVFTIDVMLRIALVLFPEH